MSQVFLTSEQDQFLKQLKIETYSDKMFAIAKAYNASHESAGKLSILNETEYESFIKAVISGEWKVDCYVINVTQPLGIANFLSAKKDENGDYLTDSNNEIIWELVDFENAQRFKKAEISRIIPKIYQGTEYTLEEANAKIHYAAPKDSSSEHRQRADDTTNNNSFKLNPSVSEKDSQSKVNHTNDTFDPIKIIKGTMDSFDGK